MEGITFTSVRKAPFVLDGMTCESAAGEFRRIPASVAEATSPWVAFLATNPAGVRARFATNAQKIVLKAELDISRRHHMPRSGENSFDLYAVCKDGKERRVATYLYGGKNDPATSEGITATVSTSGEEVTYVLYFPNYTNVHEVYVGIPDGATLSAPKNHYVHTAPVVFYGSSITQGACASRAALSYEAIVSRMLKTQFVNLGFSGSAKGEDEIVDYMASLGDMSAFVLDYDYNAPTVEHLAATHGKLYHKIRAKHPDLPIILVSRPTFRILSEENIRRRETVMRTYLFARASGDKNVHFVDGFTMMMDDTYGDGTVDTTHPNDLGFRRMAYAIGKTLDEVLRAGARRQLAKEDENNG